MKNIKEDSTYIHDYQENNMTLPKDLKYYISSIEIIGTKRINSNRIWNYSEFLIQTKHCIGQISGKLTDRKQTICTFQRSLFMKPIYRQLFFDR